eukprot:Polyplicarium_translucidae@DN2733_c0_g1_i1.p1
MITQTIASPPSAAAIVHFLEYKFVPYFGSPEAVLMDRGSEFIADEVRKFIAQHMEASIVYTSPSYPQGNAINESSHRSLEDTVKCRSSVERNVDFAELVRDATMVHNASPHGATGHPPFFMLTGQDMLLPGMARLSPQQSNPVRRSNLRDIRIRAMARSLVGDESFEPRSSDRYSRDRVAL